MITYEQLKDKSPVEFWQWCCELAEGWSLYESGHRYFRCTCRPGGSSLILDSIFPESNQLLISQLFQRTIDRVNSAKLTESSCGITSKRWDIKIYKCLKGVGDMSWFEYENYQPAHGLTSQDLARWDALLKVWEMETIKRISPVIYKKYPKGTVLIDTHNETMVIAFKFMVRDPDKEYDESRFKFVCDKPHDDGDFSYTCSSSFCRCKS